MIIQVQSCRLYIVKWIKVPAVVEREDLLVLLWMNNQGVHESKGKEDLKTATRILESYLSSSAGSLPNDLNFEGRHLK